MSIRRLRPSVHPSAASACVNAARRNCASGSSSAYPNSTPIRRKLRLVLPACRQRPRRHAAEPKYELPAPHSDNSLKVPSLSTEVRKAEPDSVWQSVQRQITTVAGSTTASKRMRSQWQPPSIFIASLLAVGAIAREDFAWPAIRPHRSCRKPHNADPAGRTDYALPAAWVLCSFLRSNFFVEGPNCHETA